MFLALISEEQNIDNRFVIRISDLMTWGCTIKSLIRLWLRIITEVYCKG